MIKRFFSLSLMIILALTAWADGVTTISAYKLWQFPSEGISVSAVTDYTPVEYEGLYLHPHASNASFSLSSDNIDLTEGKINGTFSDGTNWSSSKYLKSGNGRDVAFGSKTYTVDQKNSSISYSISLKTEKSGKLYVACSNANNQARDFKVSLRGDSESSFSVIATQNLAKYTTNTQYTISEVDAVITKPGVVYLAGVGSYLIHAIMFKPETIGAPIISQSENTITITPRASSITGTTLTTYYTTDGTTPSSTNGTEYTGAISLTGSCTIKAITVSSGGASSEVASLAYTPPAKTDISGATVNLSESSFVYNGSAQAPTVSSVVLSGNTLTSGTDYTVSEIASQTNVGTGYTVTVTGIGSYEGTASATWSITQATNTLSGTLSIEGWTYGSTANSPSGVTAAFGTVGYKYSSASDGEYGTYDAIVNGEVGTWWVKAYVDGTDNYTYVESEPNSFTISAPASNPTLTITQPSEGGTIEVRNGSTTITSGSEVAADTELTLTATPSEDYQLKSWKSSDAAYGSLPKSLVQTITMPESNLDITAEFEAQPKTAPSITEETIWTFDGFAKGTILSGTKSYVYNGLYVNGHNSDESNQAKIDGGNAAVETGISDNVTNYLEIAGAGNATSSSSLTSFNRDAVGFYAGVPGTLKVYIKGVANDRGLKFYSSGNAEASTTANTTNGTNQLFEHNITAAGNVYILSTYGKMDIYAIKFAPATYSFKATSGSNGSITVMKGEDDVTEAVAAEGGATYNYGTTLVLTPTPADDTYEFDKWTTDGTEELTTNDDISIDNTTHVLTINLKDNLTVQATFKDIPETSMTENPASFVGLSIDDDVTVISSESDYTYDDNNKTYTGKNPGNIELSIKGVKFKYTNKTGSFAIRTTDLRASSTGATITIPGLRKGQTVVVRAVSVSNTTASTFNIVGTETTQYVSSTASDMKFIATEDGSMVLTNSGAGFALYSITIHNAYTVTATSEDDSKLTVNVEGTSVDTNKYEESTNVTVTATGTGNYAFDHWSIEGNDNYSTDNPLTVSNLSANWALTAHYRELTTYTFSVTAGEGGTVKVYKDDDEENEWTVVSPVVEGTKLKLVAEETEGYSFKNWTSGEDVVSLESVYVINSLNANTNLKANFISTSSVVPVILTAGQSNTDGRISDALPSDFTGLSHCYWSYCNAQSVPSGTFAEGNRRYTPGFELYSPKSDNGTCWGYDAVVYDLVGKALNSNFYVIKQSKGNTAISPDAGGCGVYWAADQVYRKTNSEWGYDTEWFSSNTSVNSGGLSLLKAFEDNIAASMTALQGQEKLGDIKFMLWHQGECDGGSGNTAYAYYENLKAVVNHVRNYLATNYGEKYRNLPFICGTVAKNSNEYHAYVENALYRLQKDLENFYVINMSQGTFISDGVHFNQESVVRLGKKMYNKVVENGYITGSTVEVDDVDAQIYNENTYDFQNWAYVNSEITTKVGGTNPAYKAISLGSAVDETDNTLFVLNNPTKDEGMQADMNLNGRFALSSVTSNGASNDDVNFRISQNNNGATGLHTKAFSGTIPTFSILNLNAGDAITIKCSTDALTFKSTNAYLESDETKTKVTKGTKWVTGTTYIVTSGNRLDFSFGNSSAQQYIYSVVIEPAKVTETVADPVISNSLDNNTATVTISVANTELGNTPAIYYTTDGTEPSVNNNNGTQYTEPLLLTTETTIKAVAVINGLTSNVVSKVIYTNDDANTGKDDDIYDFQTWVTEMGVKGTLTRGGSDITVEGSNKVKQIQNIYASGKENNFMETHGRFAINANADVGYDKNDETKRGLRTNGDGRTAYFSILNLKSGDNITINNGVTVEGKSALRFVSTNAHKKGSTTTPSSDADNRTVWTSGDTWVMDADGRLDLMLGDADCMAYIYSIRISNRENVAAATFAKDADDDNKLIITAGTTDVETATTYYTLDGTEPTTSSTAITSSPLTLALTQDTTLITLTVGSTGKTARGYYQFTYTDTTPTAAKTFDFFNIYKNDPTFDLQMEDATKRTAYFAKKDGESMVDNSGNFYAIKASPIDSIIAWREKHVELTANGLKPTNADRPFVIRDLKKNDVIRIEFDGDIYYAKHSTRGNALKDMEPGDAITTRTAYKVASVDDTYNYVVFYPTKATTISQISINEELTPHVLPTVPSVAFSKVEEGKSVYTITYQDGETLHYQLGSDSQVDVTTASPYSLKIDKSATLSAWTSTDDGESGKLSYGVYAPTDSVYADGVYDFTKVAGTTPVEIVTSEQTVGGQTVYAPNAITSATLDRRFAFSSITGTDVRLMGETGMRVAKGKNVYIALKNLEKDKVLAINFTSTSGDDGIKFKSVSILDGATVDANVVSGQEYTINEGGNILLQVSNANASLDITSIKLGSKMKTEQADVEYQVVNNEATVTGFTTAETASEITVPASVDGASVTAIAEGTFTEENTANVTSIDLSETAVTFDSGTTRETVDELKNINEATLIYLPSTANVTGTNVVKKTGTGTDATYTCDDYQIMDGKASSVPHAFTADEAKITRTFTSGVKCTVCLPYQFTASGGSFYKFTGISDGMVEMTEQIGTLDANTPYIFVPSSDATEGALASNVTVSISDAPETVDAANHFTFKGTLEKTIWDEATAEGIYGFAANAQDGAEVGQFVRVGAGASIDAYRAYLKYEGEGTLNGLNSAPRRAPIVLPNTLSIKWIHAQGGATTIRNVEQDSNEDAPAYNLSGQRVGKDYKGIVIVNGKKVRK